MTPDAAGPSVSRPVSSTALQCGLVVDFKALEGRAEHSPPRYDNDVQRTRRLVSPVDLSGQPFGTTPINRRADLPRRSHAESWPRTAVGQDEQRHVPAMGLPTGSVDPLEVRPAVNALGARQRLFAHTGFCYRD